MSKQPKVGDSVKWNTSQGETSGHVVKKVTHPTSIAGHKVTASTAEPQFEVASDKTGKHAIHKADALHPKKG
jgi:hypothetical protein